MNINSVCIVGGGSAGWMTAAYLSKHCPFLKITLIESDKTPIVGVGESTTMRFKAYVKAMEIKDEEFMPACDATYKTSIQFTNFRRKEGDPSFQYPFGWQDFSGMQHRDLKNNIWFLIKSLEIQDLKPHTYAEWYNPHVLLIKQNKFTVDNDQNIWGDAGVEGSTAYHFNTWKFGNWLKDKFCKKVEHKLGDVEGMITGDNNTIDHLKTTAGDIHADLYIDCTGFKSALINKFSKYVSFEQKLWVDRCIPARITYKDKDKELTTVTDNFGMPNGWVYNIPNWNSIGSGYVYSSKFTDSETALKEFKDHLQHDKGIDLDRVEFGKEINLRVGRHEQSWSGNVVSLGLAFGFIEPLESNGLETVINNLQALSQTLHMRQGYVSEKFINIYNKKCNFFFDNFSDFINLHYYLSERTDTEFWKKVTNTDFSHMSFGDELGEAFNEHAFRSINAIPNGTQYISAGMNVNPVDGEIYKASLKWQIDTDLKDLKEIIEYKEKQILDFNSYISQLSDSPYKYLKKTIYKNTHEKLVLDETYNQL